MITYATEPHDAVIGEIRPLLEKHWREIAWEQERIPLAPRWDEYQRLDKYGLLHICTARHDGRLVAYYINLVQPHLHYGSTLTAFLDIFFVDPDYRKKSIGPRLFAYMESEMRKLGVKAVYSGYKHCLPEPERILSHMGFQAIETKMVKYLD